MKKILFALFLNVIAQPAIAAADAWVTSDRLDRRTCPDVKCGIVGFLMFREKVTIYEEKNGWARVSKYYYASCKNGKSEYIDSGNALCAEANGIVNDTFAEWVSVKNLSDARPKDPSIGATGDYALIKGSDDYQKYKDVFAEAASKLIKSGKCTAQDFKEMGGWMKSTNKRGPIYFTHCGGNNRMYLNAVSGEIYR